MNYQIFGWCPYFYRHSNVRVGSGLIKWNTFNKYWNREWISINGDEKKCLLCSLSIKLRASAAERLRLSCYSRERARRPARGCDVTGKVATWCACRERSFHEAQLVLKPLAFWMVRWEPFGYLNTWCLESIAVAKVCFEAFCQNFMKSFTNIYYWFADMPYKKK